MKKLSLLLKNNSVSNIVWLMSDSIIRLGLGFIVSIFLARYLGPSDFGLYNYAYAMIAIYSAVASLGMNGVVVRELVQEKFSPSIIMGTSFVLQLIGSLLASVLVVATVIILRPNEWNLVIVVLFMLPSVLLRSSDVIKYWFESIIASKYTVLAQNISFFVSSIVKICIIYFDLGYLAIASTVTLEALLVAFLLFYYYKKNANFDWSVSLTQAKRLFSISWPLVLSGVALMLYMRIDQIMIGNMIGDAAVGVYSVAVKMVEVWYFVPIAIVSTLFPKIIKMKNIDESEYNNRLQVLYDTLVIIGVLLALLVTFFSDYIINGLFDKQYAEASLLIKWYSWVGVFYFLSSASGRWYINEGLQKFALNRNVLGLTIGVILNLILIPLCGVVGSVYATLIAYSCAGYFFDALSCQTRIAFYQKSKALWLPGSFVRVKKFYLGKK